MNIGQTIFSQLMDFLPTYEFNCCVSRYRGNHRVREFSCRDQFLCMAFAQLTYRESLRDIEICLRSMGQKLYHAGFRAIVARNTLAKANENRDWRIYADLAAVLIARARKLCINEPIAIELEQTIYAFDSTTIDLCFHGRSSDVTRAPSSSIPWSICAGTSLVSCMFPAARWPM
jgi:hypothetical protein